MSPTPETAPTADRAGSTLSRDPRFGVFLLLAAGIPGAWLVWEVQRTIGLSAPRFWELLAHDRVFDLAMLDFALTALWAIVVLVERSDRKGWRFWLPLAVACAIPSVGIGLFLVCNRRREPPETR